MEGSARDRSPVMAEILRYLVEHPDAKDTIEGISQWWMPSHRKAPSRDAVQSAIDELLTRGWIVRRETSPSHVVYGLDKRHLDAITNMLRREPTPRPEPPARPSGKKERPCQ